MAGSRQKSALFSILDVFFQITCYFSVKFYVSGVASADRLSRLVLIY